MIKRIRYIISKDFNPYNNLALEEYLLNYVKEEECILYLWQNEKTVVIGKNQNAWKECKIRELEEDGGRLVRRLSGGGAVFHDLGNLNFTFLVHKDNYDLDKQLEVIIQAVKNLDIHAKKTGRNDITVEGRKFSGNAFYRSGNRSYHHGTILISVDMNNLSKYLNVSRDKLMSKGVESVKSRVINLKEYNPNLDIDRMKEELLHAFGEVYGCELTPIDQEELDEQEMKVLAEKFSSWDWIFGKKMEWTYSMDRRFSWGNIDFNFAVESGRISRCVIYSDAMDTWFAEYIPDYLQDCLFTSEHILERLNKISVDEARKDCMQDIKDMVYNERL